MNKHADFPRLTRKSMILNCKLVQDRLNYHRLKTYLENKDQGPENCPSMHLYHKAVKRLDIKKKLSMSNEQYRQEIATLMQHYLFPEQYIEDAKEQYLKSEGLFQKQQEAEIEEHKRREPNCSKCKIEKDAKGLNLEIKGKTHLCVTQVFYIFQDGRSVVDHTEQCRKCQFEDLLN